ncbi:MAG TPA: glycosyltransferase family 4 protein [Salmonella bongori]|uniref:WeiB n=3 Tax=Salmonella TaxID=590 RepID=E2DZF4_SALER|nr:glycosyltransferase family 4 protein [Salmonella bongori]ADC54983.1 WeiB [Salmonella enterica]ASG54258.1 hypothetical protein LFZ56_08155 [Salmonella bongori serovar 66:z41:- str. SA19983605]ECC9752609.1 glycosyltransferase family 4 protein [Salmonella bongori]EDP8562799.1 glycosyltransferase family 4 protein [Salmonella bongori]EDP8606870.1 glycosyltransferase family 4 protein [Salmonella bongori]
MKKVCFFVGDISRSGGTERVTCIIANYLAQFDFEIHITSIYGTNKSYFPLDLKVKRNTLFETQRRGMVNFPFVIIKLRRFIKQNNIESLISVESMLSLYSIPATANLNIQNICWEHFNYKINLNKKSRSLARYLAARYCDTVITLTERDKMYWEANLKCRATIKRIYNPVPFVNNNLDFSSSPRIALAIGRLTHQKGFDSLIKIWAQTYPHNKEWVLKIVGNGEDELYLKQLCQNYGIKNIDILPATKDIDKIYKEASLYLMTSRYEGFPMVLLEAQEYGLPILSFDCETGPAELIDNNSTGWVIEDQDHFAFEKKLIHIINLFDNDHEFYCKIRENSYRNSEKFCIDIIGPVWIDLLKKKGAQ